MGRGEVLKSSYGGKPQREEVIFMRAVDPSRYHDSVNARTICEICSMLTIKTMTMT